MSICFIHLQTRPLFNLFVLILSNAKQIDTDAKGSTLFTLFARCIRPAFRTFSHGWAQTHKFCRHALTMQHLGLRISGTHNTQTPTDTLNNTVGSVRHISLRTNRTMVSNAIPGVCKHARTFKTFTHETFGGMSLHTGSSLHCVVLEQSPTRHAEINPGVPSIQLRCSKESK